MTPRRGLTTAAIVAASLSATASAHAAPGDPARPGGSTIEVVADLPAFIATITVLSARARRAMTGPVWRKDCPVGLAQLRAVRVAYVDFGGVARVGTIVVHRAHAQRTVRAFRALYIARFPVRRIRPIEHYGGSDARSIEADNTSAFNCRRVTGGTRWSEHAYGRAIDLNPIENPYVLGGRTSHARASRSWIAPTSDPAWRWLVGRPCGPSRPPGSAGEERGEIRSTRSTSPPPAGRRGRPTRQRRYGPPASDRYSGMSQTSEQAMPITVSVMPGHRALRTSLRYSTSAGTTQSGCCGS